MHTKPCDVLKKAIPIFRWMSQYSAETAIADVIAGVTVGLTLIPQSIAYAALAGLDPQYGLYSSLFGGIIYAIFGTVPEINIAPTALLSLLIFSYTYESPFGAAPAAVLLCFFSGIIEVCCGVVHLGFLVDFVSTPVSAGLASAGALLVATAQIKNLLGLKFQAEKFVDIWINIFRHASDARLWDVVLSASCCVLLLCLRQLKNYGSPPLTDEKTKASGRDVFRKAIWFVSVGRNALVVVGCSVLAYVLEASGRNVVSLTSPVTSGLPNVSFPPFEVFANNHTYTLVEMAQELGTGILVIPFIAILANVAVAKAFSNGKTLDASQEMLAVGLCNLVGSLVSSMPVNASFSRAAVSNASGVRTTFSGVYTGILVVLSLTFLTPYFSYIPKATLASVIICAVVFMVEVNISKTIWNLNRIDFFPLIITFLACLLLGIEIGILIGIVVDALLLLYYVARPRIDVQRVMIEGNEYTKVTPTSSVYYPSIEYVREKLMRSTVEHPKSKVVIMDCSKITKTDFTAIKCMGALADDLNKNGYTIAFLHIDPNLSKRFTKVCRNCIVAFTDDALAVILKERRNSELLDNYKNINLANGTASIVLANGDSTTKL